MTPIQLDQKKRLISRMAGNIAAGMVQVNIPSSLTDWKALVDVISEASVKIAMGIVDEVDKQILIQQTAEMGEKPFGEAPWGA